MYLFYSRVAVVQIDVRFDQIGLPTHTDGEPAARYSVIDTTTHRAHRALAHPKDSFGANVMPHSAVTFQVIRISDEVCLHAEEQHKCFEA